MTRGTAPVLVEVDEAARLAPDCLFLDVRFKLGHPDEGRRLYAAAHLPGAHFVDLEADLSAPLGDGSRGRHPLPSAAAMQTLFRRLGISEGTRVVAYDDGACVYAARLWWMLRYCGHQNVSVLHGGYAAWAAKGEPVTHELPPAPVPGTFTVKPAPDRLAAVEQLSGVALLVDSREGARYRGEVEPIDPVAGHIPGAVHRFFGDNRGPDGRFLEPGGLRQSFEQLLGEVPAEAAVFYCGSGVTACNNLLAMAHAGLGLGRLYAGSWSEWCADPARPVATDG